MIECNRGCGASNLRWKAVQGKYKLFNHNDLLHICNDGVEATQAAQEKATAAILQELNISEPREIPLAEEKVIPTPIKVNSDPKKMFTITGTSSGLAITGDDKHNAIYIPKVAVSELTKALVDFI